LRISRLDLDGVGSPSALVARILEIERDLPIPVPIEELSARLDIATIEELHTDGFEAALVTDEHKSSGAILIAKGRSRQRRRFSISHELAHFVIPSHRPSADGQFLCSSADMLTLSAREQDRRSRMEVEANRFAALLLMPPPLLRSELRRRRAPDLADVIELARMFDVSKEALARAYAQWHQEAVAILVTKEGRVLRRYRNETRFPHLSVAAGTLVPEASILHEPGHAVGTPSRIDDCEPGLWLNDRDARLAKSMSEQMLLQQNGFALLLLHVELADEEDGDEHRELRW
jgi:Zn-dependent peptidase ImmA (M78 family)